LLVLDDADFNRNLKLAKLFTLCASSIFSGSFLFNVSGKNIVEIDAMREHMPNMRKGKGFQCVSP
jgi:hypothetical protein